MRFERWLQEWKELIFILVLGVLTGLVAWLVSTAPVVSCHPGAVVGGARGVTVPGMAACREYSPHRR